MVDLSDLRKKIKDLIDQEGLTGKVYFSLSQKKKIYTKRAEKTKEKLWTCEVCEKTLGVEAKEFHLKSKKHVEKINGIQRSPFHRPRMTCECGKSFYKSNLNAHLKSKIHKTFLDNGTLYINKEDEKRHDPGRVLCDCGYQVCPNFLNKHKKTEGHQQFLKDGIKITNVKPIECACGGHYLHKFRKSHYKTKKHRKYIGSTPPVHSKFYAIENN
jgi:hypothetical protein